MENIIPVYIVNKKKIDPWRFFTTSIVIIIVINIEKISNYVRLFFEGTIGIDLAMGLFLFIGIIFYAHNFQKKDRKNKEKRTYCRYNY